MRLCSRMEGTFYHQVSLFPRPITLWKLSFLHIFDLPSFSLLFPGYIRSLTVPFQFFLQLPVNYSNLIVFCGTNSPFFVFCNCHHGWSCCSKSRSYHHPASLPLEFEIGWVPIVCSFSVFPGLKVILSSHFTLNILIISVTKKETGNSEVIDKVFFDSSKFQEI